MKRYIGSGDLGHLEAQAARLRHLAGELQRDLAKWRPHLAPAVVKEVTGRIARHLVQAEEFEATANRCRYAVGC